MRPSLARLALPAALLSTATAAALAPPAAAQSTPDAEPTCDTEVYRCPDLMARAPANLFVKRTPAGRRLLYATNRLDNVGRGPLEVRGYRSSTARRSMRAVQIVRRRSSRSVLRHSAGSVVFKPIPGQGAYWKFSQALRFELRRTSGDRDVVRQGPKVIYCLRDLFRQPFVTPGTPRNRVFGACNQSSRATRVTMGIAQRWRESYPAGYHEQYVDVSGLRGCYALWHVADPFGRLRESDETNNANATRVRLPVSGRTPRSC